MGDYRQCPYSFHWPEEFTRLSDGVRFSVGTAPREALIALLQWNDPNGCYSDHDSEVEFGAPCETEFLRACARELFQPD
jgi:hypothetical protein